MSGTAVHFGDFGRLYVGFLSEESDKIQISRLTFRLMLYLCALNTEG